VTRLVTQATPQTNGSFSLVYFKDQFVFRDKMKDYDPKNPGNILFYFKQEVTAPARLAGPCAAGARNPRSGERTAFGVGLQRRSTSRASCAASVLRRTGYRRRRPAYLRQPGHVQRRA
jgi:hypothetical protein